MPWWVCSESFWRLHYIIVADSSQLILALSRVHYLSKVKLFASGSIGIRLLILPLSLQVTRCSHKSLGLIKLGWSAWGQKLHPRLRQDRTINFLFRWVTFNPYPFSVLVVLLEPIVLDQQVSSDSGWLVAPCIYDDRPSVQRHSAAVAALPESVHHHMMQGVVVSHCGLSYPHLLWFVSVIIRHVIITQDKVPCGWHVF